MHFFCVQLRYFASKTDATVENCRETRLQLLSVPVLIRLLGFGFYAATGGTLLSNPITPLTFIIVFLIFLIVPLFEEFGWRGYLLPALLTRWSPVRSGLCVGIVWAGWHIPLFWIEGTGFYRWGQASGLLGRCSFNAHHTDVLPHERELATGLPIARRDKHIRRCALRAISAHRNSWASLVVDWNFGCLGRARLPSLLAASSTCWHMIGSGLR
jgi:Type II CAAX prenyl endopeptidase Rce1-like